jgi:hypothetical protein
MAFEALAALERERRLTHRGIESSPNGDIDHRDLEDGRYGVSLPLRVASPLPESPTRVAVRSSAFGVFRSGSHKRAGQLPDLSNVHLW